MSFKNIAKAILILAGSAILTACGQTVVNGGSTTASGVSPNPGPTPVANITSCTNNTCNPLLNYQISQLGDQIYVNGSLSSTSTCTGFNCNSTYTTANITTDNVLRVKFRVGTNLGNQVVQANLLKVTVTVNGQNFTPTYEASNYSYGLPNELSNRVDLSGTIIPGAPLTITVGSPMDDWPYLMCVTGYNTGMCGKTYQPTYYDNTWSGTLYVETSNTVSIDTVQ